MKFIPIDELMKQPLPDELPALLRAAAKQVEAGRLDSAAWRLADACLLLVQRIEAAGTSDVPGVHRPTGRGGMICPPDVRPALPPCLREATQSTQEPFSGAVGMATLAGAGKRPEADSVACPIGTIHWTDDDGNATHARDTNTGGQSNEF